MLNAPLSNNINKAIIINISPTVCSICAQNHYFHDCPFLFGLRYIPDEPLTSRALQTLPKVLKVARMADGSTKVITTINLEQGTTFGPLYAKRLTTMNPSTNFPIKIFDTMTSTTHYLDCTNENESNWMCFIAPASNVTEQNLICYQMNKQIFFTTTCAISIGGELKVWYAPYYALQMKIPLLGKYFANDSKPSDNGNQGSEMSNNDEQMALLNKDSAQELAETLPAESLGATQNKDIWNCKLCSSVINSVVSYAKHLMDHYKLLMGVICRFCNKKFKNPIVLERHEKMKHSNSLGRDDIGNHDQNSQEIFLNLNDHLESLDKFSSDKHDNIEQDLLKVCSPTKEINSDLPLLDTHSINVNDLLLQNICSDPTHELSSEFLNIVSDENNDDSTITLVCDICNKKFDKLDYLYRHLRKHTGEFICPSCLTVFARKENLLSHTCFAQKALKETIFECSICGKSFLQKKYLKRHMFKHTESNCKWCNREFTSRSECDSHECSVPKHVCLQCRKRFVHKAHLNRHLKSHNDQKSKVKARIRRRRAQDRPAICEKCGDVFKNFHTLRQHMNSHGERMFECEICNKKFHRISVLKEHKIIHQNSPVSCDVCGRKMKSKKGLDIHMLLHGDKNFQCEKCDKSFYQRSNYLKHYKQMHGERTTWNCPHCPSQFSCKSSYIKHIKVHSEPAQYFCNTCPKSFHREYQLRRHKQASHSNVVYRCPFCNTTARHSCSIRRHFERRHIDQKNEWDKPNFVKSLIETTQCTKEEFNTEGIISSDLQPIEQFQGINHSQILDKVQIDTFHPGNGDTLLKCGQENSNLCPLSQVESPSTSTTNQELHESVLRNACIFDDNDRDMMFYVFNNSSINEDF